MNTKLNHDFTEIEEGARITLHPSDANLIQKGPQVATFSGGYFFLDGAAPEELPSYYMGDVAAFCRGWLPADEEVAA